MARGCYVERELSFGSFGTDVSCLQDHLRTEQLYKGKLTGHYGSLTRDAVAAWQVQADAGEDTQMSSPSLCSRARLNGSEAILPSVNRFVSYGADELINAMRVARYKHPI